jgi:CubicO group peptidase (beta-lactamase class C family)
MATPLWYLRTLLWVLLLAPLLLRLLRRGPLAATVVGAAGVAAVVTLEWLERGLGWTWSVAPHSVWQVGDVVLYGLFFAFGMWVRTADRQLAPRAWAIASAGLAALAVAVWRVAPPPGGVVNDSHVVHLVVGATLLCLVLAAARPIGRVAEVRWVRPVVELLGQRSLTIYLWHTTAVAVALWALARLGVRADGSGALAYALLIVLGTAALVLATGWLEDWAARRRVRAVPLTLGPAARAWWSRPVVAPVAAAVVVAVLVASVGVPALTGRSGVQAAFAPRVPSQAPPPPSLVPASAEEPAWWSFPATIDPDVLESVLAGWAEDNGVAGASVALSVPDGGSWVGVTGVGDDGEARSPASPVDIMSVTKLFTANLVYRAVDLGLIGLDDPLPPLAALPDLPLTGKVTVRQLLAHRSGLANYRDTETYQLDPSVVQGPADAVAVSLTEPVDEPGLSARYSSTNYLILGYLLEQLMGISFDDLLTGALLGPMGLEHTWHLAPAPGEPRFATAGIVADIEDLARAGEGLLVDHVGISDDAWREMSAMDPEAGLGAGTMQFCPCSERDGEVEAFALGYAGGHTLLALLPRYDVVVALDVTGDFYGEQGHFDAVEPLLRSLAGLLRQAPTSLESAQSEPA